MSNLFKSKKHATKGELLPKRGFSLITHEEAIEVCQFDAVAKKIIKNAPGKSYQAERAHRAIRTSNIVNDFFAKANFERKTCLELGPGHYNFALIARHLGAEVICVERDRVHAELGRHLGFKVVEEDIFESTELITESIDGIWLKNVQYRGDYSAIDQNTFVDKLTSMLNPGGWGWCILRNKKTEEDLKTKPPEQVPELTLQRDLFSSFGWKSSDVVTGDRKRYALNFAGAPWIFTRNLLEKKTG